jgi:hypothetical protein
MNAVAIALTMADTALITTAPLPARISTNARKKAQGASL